MIGYEAADAGRVMREDEQRSIMRGEIERRERAIVRAMVLAILFGGLVLAFTLWLGSK